MSLRKEMTVIEKLLITSHKLAEEGKDPFTAEDLVVAAWREFPDTFGLAGYRGEKGDLCYPDSNRVFAEIMGSKPIRKRGYLVKTGEKMYRLTESGREHARLILSRESRPDIKKAGLGREVKKELNRLLASKASEKSREGRSEDLTFFDACGFWGISPRSRAIDLETRIANFFNIISTVKEVVEGKDFVFEHGGNVITTGNLDYLVKVHEELTGKFENEISIIKSRTDER